MLIHNGKVLNLSEPTTETEKRVVKEIAALVDKYNLDSGGTVSIVYPKEYIKANKHNPGKPFRPASMKISFRDMVKGKTGTDEWRWASGVTAGDKPSFYPTSRMFDGSWQLTVADSDLLYFLVKFSSRLQGGENASQNKRPYIVIENKVGDAVEFADNLLKTAFIQTTVFKTMAEVVVREFAKTLGLNTWEKEQIALLRRTVYSMVTGSKDGYDKLVSFTDKGSDVDKQALTSAKMLVAELVKNEVVTLKEKTWIYNTGEMKGATLLKTKTDAGSIEPENQLAVYLAKNKPTAGVLSDLIPKE